MSYWDEDRNPDAAGAVGEPTSVTRLLDAVARRRGWGPRLEGARAVERWEEIAGDVLGAHVRPVRLLGGVLVVAASDGGWAQQVRALSGDLARRANAVLGAGSVRQVTVVVARPGEEVDPDLPPVRRDGADLRKCAVDDPGWRVAPC